MDTSVPKYTASQPRKCYLNVRPIDKALPTVPYPFQDEAQTALFKHVIRTAQ